MIRACIDGDARVAEQELTARHFERFEILKTKLDSRGYQTVALVDTDEAAMQCWYDSKAPPSPGCLIWYREA